ncbi:hypothetical protein PGQ11_012635 [Apiospora arundinis]|uniref:Uncharacterized protein n=1 Tax=Apiospora arundinis TaxID=335852 RepID=A0ABR2I2Y4_9PEZI
MEEEHNEVANAPVNPPTQPMISKFSGTSWCGPNRGTSSLRPRAARHNPPPSPVEHPQIQWKKLAVDGSK